MILPIWLERADHSKPFITGNGFASLCKHVTNYDGYKCFADGNENWVFCKTDFVHSLFDTRGLPDRFILFTHNSDFAITADHLHILNSDRVLHWYAANTILRHDKLTTVPLGIANAGYAHGNAAILSDVMNRPIEKTKDFYLNFNVSTNPQARSYCLSKVNLPAMPADESAYDFAGGYKQPKSFERYLDEMAAHKFAIAPQGNGVDCLRYWEAIYLKTIPIVVGYPWHNKMKVPIIWLNDWADFKRDDFSKQRYDDVWGDFDVSSLFLSSFVTSLTAGTSSSSF